MVDDAQQTSLITDFFAQLHSETNTLKQEARSAHGVLGGWEVQSTVLVIGNPSVPYARVKNERILDTLSILFDRIVLLDPTAHELVPADNPEARSLAEKIGALCEARVIRTIPSYAPHPLESWTEKVAFEAIVGINWGHFVNLQPWYSFEDPVAFAFCRAFDEILERQLRKDPLFRALYKRAFPRERIWAFRPWSRDGFWELKCYALSPYVLCEALGVNVVLGSNLLTAYGHAALMRLLRLSKESPDDASLEQPIGGLEAFIPIIERMALHFPIKLTPDDLLRLRDNAVVKDLRAWLQKHLALDAKSESSTITELAEAFNDLTASAKGRKVIVDSSLTALISTAGYHVGGLLGAVLGNVGAIPLIHLTQEIIENLRDKRLKRAYDFLNLHPHE